MIVDQWLDRQRRLKPADMPRLRALRDAFRTLGNSARDYREREGNPAMLLAYSSVIHELDENCRIAGVLIERLQRAQGRAVPGRQA